jgi:hypothetical protein
LQTDLVHLRHVGGFAVGPAEKSVPVGLSEDQKIFDVKVLICSCASPFVRDLLHVPFVGAVHKYVLQPQEQHRAQARASYTPQG